jgi:hypothetical protein
LARLQQLAGNLEGAARAWTDAARAEPGRPDAGALTEGARAYLALGEYGQARLNLGAVLGGAPDRENLLRARCLSAQLDAFEGGRLEGLLGLLEDSGFREYRPVIWYTLWRISGDEGYRARLLAESPGSPEARIAAGDATVGLVPQALWFLFPGRESLAAGPPAALAPPPGGGSLLPPLTTEITELTGEPAAALQAGLFSREENAQALARRLRAAGFSPSLSLRRVSAADYWSVLVPAGADMQQTILHLKDAGFEAFPLF